MRASVIFSGLLAVFGLLTASISEAGNPQRGLEKSQVCQACHGEDGNLVLEDDYPKLGGQYYDYLVHALKAYRSGSRQHDVMTSFAQDLSDQDIRDLAAWYSQQDGLVPLRIR